MVQKFTGGFNIKSVSVVAIFLTFLGILLSAGSNFGASIKEVSDECKYKLDRMEYRENRRVDDEKWTHTIAELNKNIVFTGDKLALISTQIAVLQNDIAKSEYARRSR